MPPEIKNQTKTEAFKPESALQPPHAEKLLELPRRRSRWGIILTLVILCLIVAAGAFAFLKYYKPAPVQTQPLVQQTKEKVVPLGTNYYLAETQDLPSTIYKYSSNASEQDQKVGTVGIKNISILGKWTQPYTYVVHGDDTQVQTLDATTGEVTPLFEVPAKTTVRDVALSQDQKFLAYAITDDSDAQNPTSEIWLYDVVNKQSKKLVQPVKLSLYEGFSIIGWRSNDKEIIASAIGCDGPACGGDLYDINFDSGQATKIANPETKGKNNFLGGELSPNHDLWLYDYCAQPDDKVIKANGYSDACATGAELHTYDFGTKQVKLVYQNSRYGNNADKSTLRTIMSYQWLDAKTVIAAVPGAMLKIDLSDPTKTTGNDTEIFVYDQNQPQKFTDNMVSLVAVSPAQIVFTREDGWHVYDQVSHKIVNINLVDPKSQISNWLD